MPRIPDKYLECVVYLYPSVKDAEDGTHIGGTGFLFGVKCERISNAYFIFVATNRHVVEAGNHTIRLNTLDGSKGIIEGTEQFWTFSSQDDDLAVALTTGINKFQVKWISFDQFITKALIAHYDVGPGDDTFMVGRFINHEGRQRNLPSLRFGNIAQMPWEPIVHIRGFKKVEQESFLIECRSIPGFSGAPVFVYIPPFSKRPKEKTIDAVLVGPYLLGIDWCHINDPMPAYDDAGKQLSFKVRSNSGMMGVIPAWRLREMFDMEPLKSRVQAMEAEAVAKRAKSPSPVNLDVARPEIPASDENPNAREDFTRLANAAARKQKPDE